MMSLHDPPKIGATIHQLQGTVVPNISLHATATTERFGWVVVQRSRVVSAREAGR